MGSIASTLAAAAASALLLALPTRGADGGDAKPSPEPATSVATAWPAGPAAAQPARAAEPPVPAAPIPPPRAPVAPSQAVVERLGKGDRLALTGDDRGALFAYQDAVYLQPAYGPARVRLGRAYLVLRYPAQAIAQAEAVLAADPDDLDARRLLEEATAAQAGAIAPVAPAHAPAGGALAPELPPAR